MSVTAPLREHARRDPQGTAIAFEGDRISWLALDEAVDRLAARLRGLVPEDRGIALALPNCPALAVLFLAAARAGREAQVLDPAWPAEMTRTVLDALAPALLASAAPAAGHAHLPVDPGAPFREAVADAADALGAPGGQGRVPEPEPSLPFYVGFTSGSTGVPKGYRRSHLSWIDSFRGDGIEFGIGPEDTILAPGTLTHSLFLYALLRGLHAGAAVVLCRGFRPGSLARLIRAEGVTVVYAVPTQLSMLMDAAEAARAPASGEAPLGGVRLVLSSGAKWQEHEGPRLRRLFPRAAFAEFYGCSELSYVAVAKDSEAPPPGSVGRAFPGVEITIRDARGRRLPPGRTGLVFVRSPLRFMGYACGGDGLIEAGDALSVGDLGFLDGRGFLHLVGRASRMIVSSGRNIHPEEVEAALRSHPAVEAAAVLGVPDDRRGERAVALLKRREGRPVGRAGLVAHARALLPLYKVPRVYAEVAQWPLTPSGKTDFQALRRLWDAGECEAMG
jgi:long-chain acyl-CoA synthetase